MHPLAIRPTVNSTENRIPNKRQYQSACAAFDANRGCTDLTIAANVPKLCTGAAQGDLNEGILP